MRTREQIVDFIDEQGLEDEEIVLFDGMEDAFLGVAERFEDGGHRYFAVYGYEKMIAVTMDGDLSEQAYDDAREYVEFNVVGLYAGEGTPAILHEMENP